MCPLFWANADRGFAQQARLSWKDLEGSKRLWSTVGLVQSTKGKENGQYYTTRLDRRVGSSVRRGWRLFLEPRTELSVAGHGFDAQRPVSGQHRGRAAQVADPNVSETVLLFFGI
jgi:hypothetical protein